MSQHEHTQNPQAELEAVVASSREALDRGEQPDRQALLAHYPHLAQDLQSYFANQHLIQPLAQPLREGSAEQSQVTVDSLPEAASGHLLGQPDTPTQDSQAGAFSPRGQGAGAESGERFGDHEILSKIEAGACASAPTASAS
jgi:hypothetical protein